MQRALPTPAAVRPGLRQFAGGIVGQRVVKGLVGGGRVALRQAGSPQGDLGPNLVVRPRRLAQLAVVLLRVGEIAQRHTDVAHQFTGLEVVEAVGAVGDELKHLLAGFDRVGGAGNRQLGRAIRAAKMISSPTSRRLSSGASFFKASMAFS